MKIKEYPKTSSLVSTDSFIVETSNGTKRVEFGDLDIQPEQITMDPIVLHRNTYRGKNLGTEFTEEQKEAIRTGTFNDLYIGDYWEINGFTWRIADIDYFYKIRRYSSETSFTEVTDHHLVIFPDVGLYKTKIHTSRDLTSCGYLTCYLNTTGKSQAINLIKNSFGSNSLMDMIVDVHNTSRTIGSYEIDVIPPKIEWLTGSVVVDWNQIYAIGVHQTPPNTQMSLFRLNPSRIIDFVEGPSYKYYWTYLLFGQSATHGGFGTIGSRGEAYWAWADDENAEFRPMFCIKGE